MIPVSISGFGVREGAFVLLFGLIGVKPEAATAISLSWFVHVHSRHLGTHRIYSIKKVLLNM